MTHRINLEKFDSCEGQTITARGYIERNGINLNWSDIRDKLIRLTAKYTDFYASDVLISINSIQQFLDAIQTHGAWYFGFREGGVDHGSFITPKYEYELNREYRAIWRLTLYKVEDGYTDNAIEMSLCKVWYNPYKKVG